MRKTKSMYAYAPYGTRELDPFFKEEWFEHIGQDDYYDRSRHKHDLDYITTIPMKHPLIESITGVYPLEPIMPEWWSIGLSSYMNDPLLKWQLEHVTLEEFQAGVIDDKVWKAFRNSLRSSKENYPQSPKLGGILENAYNKGQMINRSMIVDFNQRDSASSGLYALHISTNPRDFFYMRDGQGWSSCTNYKDGGSMDSIPGNFMDTTRGIAYILPQGTELGEDTETGDTIRMYARTTFRIMHSMFVPDYNYYMVDRCYTAVPGIRDNMIRALFKRFKEASTPYGTMRYSDAFNILKEENPSITENNFSKFYSPLVGMDITFPYTDGSSNYEIVTSTNSRSLYAFTADCIAKIPQVEIEDKWIG